jgi:alkylation response protein AidB-like acyl-CoA dehydrogenase
MSDYNAMPDAEFRDMVREFIEASCPKHLRHSARSLTWKDADPWTKALGARGWLCPGWPVEHGGMGLDIAKRLVFQEELDRAGTPFTPAHGPNSIGPLIMRFGSEAQKQFFLPKIASGNLIFCQGYSEPNAGSDLARLSTHAVLEGEHWVVNGQKVWTSNAHLSDWIFMLVRTDREAKPQAGITMLLADMKTPGIEARPIRTLSGASETAQAFFDNVRVPRDSVLGPVNGGWGVAKALLGFERLMLGSPRQAREQLAHLEIVARGRGLFADALFVDAFLRLRMDIDDLSALHARHGEVLKSGGELGAEVSVLKIWSSETYQRVCDALVAFSEERGATLGPAAYGDGEVDVLANYFFSRVAGIYGGTNDIQRNILARTVLDLPSG